MILRLLRHKSQFTKIVIRRHNSKKDNNTMTKEKKRSKGQTIVKIILHRKLKIEQHQPIYNTVVNSYVPERYAFPASLMEPVVLPLY